MRMLNLAMDACVVSGFRDKYKDCKELNIPSQWIRSATLPELEIPNRFHVGSAQWLNFCHYIGKESKTDKARQLEKNIKS